MCELYNILKPENSYYDRLNFTQEEYNAAIEASSTVYVGNLSYQTTQDSIRELFSLGGKVVEIIMGINKEGHACGFCFVIYETHEEAGYAVDYISKTRLNDRIIRVDWDPGYKKGREVGRGTGGQQRREDFRTKEDGDRPRKRNTYEGRDKEREYRAERAERGGERYDRGDRGDRGERRDRGDRGDRGEDRGGDRERDNRRQRGDNRQHRYRRQYDRQQRNDRHEPRQERGPHQSQPKQGEKRSQDITY